MRGGHWAWGVLPSALVVAAALSGCSPSGSHTPIASQPASPGQSAESPPAPEKTFGPTAVVSIASVDVDGRNVTVAGLISGASEANGTCRFSLTSDLTGVGVEAATTGQDNGNNVSCGAAQIPITQVSKGPWSVVLHYTSHTLTLDSARVELEIP